MASACAREEKVTRLVRQHAEAYGGAPMQQSLLGKQLSQGGGLISVNNNAESSAHFVQQAEFMMDSSTDCYGRKVDIERVSAAMVFRNPPVSYVSNAVRPPVPQFKWTGPGPVPDYENRGVSWEESRSVPKKAKPLPCEAAASGEPPAEALYNMAPTPDAAGAAALHFAAEVLEGRLEPVYAQTDYGQTMYLGNGRDHGNGSHSPQHMVNTLMIRAYAGKASLLQAFGHWIEEWCPVKRRFVRVAGKF